MKIEMDDAQYDVRLRHKFVASKKSGQRVRQTNGTISAIDPSKSGAEKYTLLYSTTLTQNVNDKDDKFSARKRMVGRLLHCVFTKAERKMLWKNIILSDKSIVGQKLVEDLASKKD